MDYKQTGISIQWHITEKCSNNCKHCYMDKNTKDLSSKQFDLIIDSLKTLEKTYGFYIERFSLTGGDPLESYYWYEISKKLVSWGKKVSFLGNPELLNQDNIKKLKELKIESYQVSLDGLEATHDFIRSQGSFKRTINAIKLLNEINIPVNVMFTMSSLNESELIPLIDYIDSLGVNVRFAFDFMIPIGNGEKIHQKFNFNMEKIFSEYLTKKASLLAKNSKLYLTEKSSFIYAHKFKHNIINFDNFKNINCEACTGCMATLGHFTILNNGDVCVCRRMPVILGNILKDNLIDIFIDNDIIKKFQCKNENSLCKNCKYYKFCRGCSAIFSAYKGQKFICPYFEEEIDMTDYKYKTIGEIMYQNKESIFTMEYYKAVILLNVKNERQLFISDINAWQKKHNISLNQMQIDFIRYNLLHV